MVTIDFYYSDLTPEAQQRFLDAQNLESAAEGNYDADLLPIFSVDVEED